MSILGYRHRILISYAGKSHMLASSNSCEGHEDPRQQELSELCFQTLLALWENSWATSYPKTGAHYQSCLAYTARSQSRARLQAITQAIEKLYIGWTSASQANGPS